MTRSNLILSLVAAVALAACGGGSSSPSSSGSPQALQVTRGAITARSPGSVTVNGLQLSTSSAAVREDRQAATEDRLARGQIVTVRGTFDDRGGHATEIEIHHGLEGQIDDKGTDFVVIGGQRVNVDDSTEFEVHHPGRLADLSVGNVVAISGVPDDRGGLRASRIDDSPRQVGPTASRDDFDIKGFVSSLQANGFELRITPDASARYLVDTTGIALPASLKDGSIVEVHSLSRPTPGTAPVIATIHASSVVLEDRIGGAQTEAEIEGIVTSGTSALFVIDGTTVVTDGSTRWTLGAAADLVPGVKVEAEGQLDDQGALHAHKVSFRAGARITAVLQNVSFDGTSGTATLLGIPVQLPSFARYDVAPANGLLVEARGNPSATGNGIVALRISAVSVSGGNPDRVWVRGVVTAKGNATAAAPTFTVLGFDVTSAGAKFRATDDSLITADAFFAAVESGHTVIKVRAAIATDVSGTSFKADELEIEGDE